MGQPINSILQFTMGGTVNGQATQTVRHYLVNTVSALASAGPEELAFLARMRADVTSTYNLQLACMSNVFHIDTLIAQFVSPVRIVRVAGTVGDPGGIGTGCKAQNVQGSITRRTFLAGRRQVSTLKIGALPEDQYNAGLIAAGQLTRYAVLCGAEPNNVVPAAGGGVYTPCIWHGPAPSTASDVITAGITHPEVRVSRRRTVGLGI